ncbi:MAG: hypothetical protein WCZ90_09830 [Melioribacteraceae bacterium]
MKNYYQIRISKKKKRKSVKDSEIELHETTIEIYNWIRRDNNSSKTNSFDIQKVTAIGTFVIKTIEFIIRFFCGGSEN